MTTSEELKPCPFCGSSDIQHSNNKEPFWNHWVQCENCKASSDAGGGEGTQGAIARWNRRALASEGEAESDETAYGKACFNGALEAAAMECENLKRGGQSMEPDSPRADLNRQCMSCAAAIRALKLP